MGLGEEAVGVEEWRRKGGDLGGGPEEEAAGVEEEKRKGGAGRGGRGGGYIMGIGSKPSNELMEASVEYSEDSEEGGEQREKVE